MNYNFIDLLLRPNMTAFLTSIPVIPQYSANTKVRVAFTSETSPVSRLYITVNNGVTLPAKALLLSDSTEKFGDFERFYYEYDLTQYETERFVENLSLTITGFSKNDRVIGNYTTRVPMSKSSFSKLSPVHLEDENPVEDLIDKINDIQDQFNKKTTPDAAIQAHNADPESHPDIRQSISNIIGERRAQADWLESDSLSLAYIRNKPTLSLVAKTGSYLDLKDAPTISTVGSTGRYSDLIDAPTLSNVALSGEFGDLKNKPDKLPNPGKLIIVREGSQVAEYNGERDITVEMFDSEQTQPDWNETNTLAASYIKNKPTRVSEFANDAGFITSLSEADPTVPDWAKAPTKPTYDYSEILNRPIVDEEINSSSTNLVQNKAIFRYLNANYLTEAEVRSLVEETIGSILNEEV